MGKLVVFWSPYAGVAKVTASLCAVACGFGMQYPEAEVAICSVGPGLVRPEEYLLEQRTGEFSGNVYGMAGIENLKLNFRKTMLSPEIIRRSAVSLKMKSLFVYPGNSLDGELDEISVRLLEQTLKQEFDCVFLDLGNGKQSQETHFLELADLIVVVLPQAQRYYRDFLEKKNDFFKNGRYCILFGGYLGKYPSGRKLHALVTGNDVLKEAGVIPLNTGFFRAMEERNVVDFFYRNQRAGKKEENYEFISQTKKAAKEIRRNLFL